MTPTIGRIVVYTEGSHEGRGANGTNGTRQHPAIVTRVWSDECVNLHVFMDGFESEVRCSVTRLPELPEGVENTSGNAGWSWPVRETPAVIDAEISKPLPETAPVPPAPAAETAPEPPASAAETAPPDEQNATPAS